MPADAARRRLVLACAAAAALPRHAAAQAPDPARAAASERQAEVVSAARAAVLPLGIWNPTASPRFAFRGSAFPIDGGRRVATCAHVLPPPDQVQARLMVLAETAAGPREGRTVRVLASERSRDVAVLEVEGPPLPNALELGAPSSIRDGHSVLLMGYPIGGAFGFTTVTHQGIVAAITTVAVPAATAASLDARAVSAVRQGNHEVLQLDAVAYPGNSGGPVIDVRDGRVIGLLSMAAVKGSRESALSSPTGISYAIPVRYLHELLATL